MKKYLVTLEFPPPDNCLNGEVDWAEVEAETEDEAEDNARRAVIHRIRLCQIKEISSVNDQGDGQREKGDSDTN
jgi:hypothetical protein